MKEEGRLLSFSLRKEDQKCLSCEVLIVVAPPTPMVSAQPLSHRPGKWLPELRKSSHLRTLIQIIEKNVCLLRI